MFKYCLKLYVGQINEILILIHTVGWPKPATYQYVVKHVLSNITMLVLLLCLMVMTDFLPPSQQSKTGEQGSVLLFIL